MNTKYDIHCHIFNKNVLTRNLFGVLTAALALTKTKSKTEILNKIEGITKTLNFLNNADFNDIYKHLEAIYEEPFVLTPLMMDLTFADDADGTYGEIRRYRRRIEFVFRLTRVTVREIMKQTGDAGTRKKIKNLDLQLKQFYKNFDVNSDGNVKIFSAHNYQEQINSLNVLARQYPNSVKPFYCVDPRQERKNGINTIQALKDNLKPNGNFVGVKIYTPLGYSPLDPILMGTKDKTGVYEYCIDNNIPITVHNSNAGFACFSKHVKVFGEVNMPVKIDELRGTTIEFKKQFLGLRAGEAIEERAFVLNHPKLWEKVLQRFPTLKINLAHFGGSSQIMDYVDYAFRKNAYEEHIFNNALKSLSNEQQVFVKSYFRKGRFRMVLKCDAIASITLANRAKLWNTLYKAGLIDNWAKDIFDIIKNTNYPNVYTDLSCFSEYDYNTEVVYDVCNPKKRSKQEAHNEKTVKDALVKFKQQFYNKLTSYEKGKILYGSDYFLIEFMGVQIKQYVSDFESAFKNEFQDIASKHPHAFLTLKKVSRASIN